MELAQILDACPFLAAVEEPARARLLAIARKRRFARGTVIFREGDPCPGLFVVGSGQVRIYKIGPTGKEHVIHLVGAGQTFAEVAAIGGFACPAYAEALEPSECALLPATEFNDLLRRDHPLCLQLMAAMASWVRQLVGLLEDLVLRDAVGRVARYLLGAMRSPGRSFALPSLKRHLASHLNLTGETLSRALRRLEDDGLIERTAGGRLRVIDPDALAQVGRPNEPRL